MAEAKQIFIVRNVWNADLLNQQLSAALGELFKGIGNTKAGFYVVLSGDATAQDENTARTIVLNHDETQLTIDQQRAIEKRILFEQVNARFVAEVIKQTPDWLSCYDDIAAMVTGQTAVTNALANIITLTNDVFLLTGITVGGTRHKKQQILTFIQVLALWSTSV